MAGTRAGGRKAAATIKARHGDDFYQRLGEMSGNKGFASEKTDKNGMNGFQRAKIYGSVAGQISAYNRTGTGKTNEAAKDDTAQNPEV